MSDTYAIMAARKALDAQYENARNAKLNPDWVVSVPYGTSGHVCGFVFSDAEAGMKTMREVANLFNSIQSALAKQ